MHLLLHTPPARAIGERDALLYDHDKSVDLD